jgi:hypothetical protein
MKLYPVILTLLAIGAATPIVAEQKNVQSNVPATLTVNAPGITDKEIKIGQTMPYSGPISAFGAIGRAELAYFKKINDQGASTAAELT